MVPFLAALCAVFAVCALQSAVGTIKAITSRFFSVGYDYLLNLLVFTALTINTLALLRKNKIRAAKEETESEEEARNRMPEPIDGLDGKKQ
jgi:hypothetical protein